MPGTVLVALHVFSHLIPMTVLYSRFSYAPFIESEVLCASPWTLAHRAPLSMEFSRKEDWSGLPCPSPGHLPHPGIEPGSPVLQADSLQTELSGKPKSIETECKFVVARG